jgi:hypothetical protein
MYKPSIYLPSNCLFYYLFSYLSTYYIYETYFLEKLVTKVKPNINSSWGSFTTE